MSLHCFVPMTCQNIYNIIMSLKSFITTCPHHYSVYKNIPIIFEYLKQPIQVTTTCIYRHSV